MLVLRRNLGVEVVVGVHVAIVDRRHWLILLMIIWPSPTHILLHAMPCRQMTSVHHAGVDVFRPPDALGGWRCDQSDQATRR